MPDDEPKVTASRPIDMLKIPIVSAGDASKLETGTIATTESAHAPNIVTIVIPPIQAVCIRFANTFCVQLVGLLVAAMTPTGGKLLYTGDFFHLLLTCASLALPGAALGFFKDLITIFGRLEQKYPLLTGNV